MNRIYQGRDNKVQILKPAVTKPKSPEDWQELDSNPNEARRLGEELLWNHHQLFQDAVNYYIVALASLGSSPESKLTKLRGLLGKVWEGFDKKGQCRQGMRDSLQRAWQLAEPPALEEAIMRFQNPLIADKVPLTTAEKAGEYLLFKLGGEAAIQQGGRDFLPMFCDVESMATFKLSASRRGRADDEARLQYELHRDLTDEETIALSRSITLGSVVNLQPNSDDDVGETVVSPIRASAATFADELTPDTLEQWLGGLDVSFSLPKRRGGNINIKRVDACTLFLAFPNALTKSLFQKTYSPPRAKSAKVQADEVEDAAANLAFRAVAHPSAAHIHHRLRTERKKGAKGQDDLFLARKARRFGKEKVVVLLRDQDSLPKERNTNLFFDEFCVAKFGRVRLETDASDPYPYASGPGLWRAVNDRADQWKRCMQINAARLRSWGIEPPPGWEMPKPRDFPTDPGDNIPM